MDRNSAPQVDKGSVIKDLPKKHLFLPSCNFMWEINSKKDKRSYFVDPKIEFCTCKGYYYNYKDKRGCYHLEKITECIPSLSYKILLYHDDYFSEFLKRIVFDIVYND